MNIIKFHESFMMTIVTVSLNVANKHVTKNNTRRQSSDKTEITNTTHMQACLMTPRPPNLGISLRTHAYIDCRDISGNYLAARNNITQ